MYRIQKLFFFLQCRIWLLGGQVKILAAAIGRFFMEVFHWSLSPSSGAPAQVRIIAPNLLCCGEAFIIVEGPWWWKLVCNFALVCYASLHVEMLVVATLQKFYKLICVHTFQMVMNMV